MRVLLFIGISFCLLQDSSAQLIFVPDQFMYQRHLINPGGTGSEGYSEVQLVHHSQWQGLEGSPTVGQMCVEGTLRGQPIGLGLLTRMDRIGAFQRAGLGATFSHQLKLKEGLRLGLGLSGRYFKQDLIVSELDPSEEGDPLLNRYQSGFSQELPYFVFGSYLQSEYMYFGLSYTGKLRDKKESTSAYSKSDPFGNSGFVDLIAGRKFYVNEFFNLKTDIHFIFQPREENRYLFHTRLNYLDAAQVGFTFEKGKALGFLARTRTIENLFISYSYTIGASHLLRGFNTQELGLSYRFYMDKGNPRRLRPLYNLDLYRARHKQKKARFRKKMPTPRPRF